MIYFDQEFNSKLKDPQDWKSCWSKIYHLKILLFEDNISSIFTFQSIKTKRKEIYGKIKLYAKNYSYCKNDVTLNSINYGQIDRD